MTPLLHVHHEKIKFSYHDDVENRCGIHCVLYKINVDILSFFSPERSKYTFKIVSQFEVYFVLRTQYLVFVEVVVHVMSNGYIVVTVVHIVVMLCTVGQNILRGRNYKKSVLLKLSTISLKKMFL